MKKTLKGPATVFFILALVFTVAWVAVFLLFGLLLDTVNFKFDLLYKEWLQPRVEGFLPFFQGKTYGFTPAESELFYLTYVGFGLLGIMLIFMIIGFILSIKRKRARYIFFGLVMLVAAVGAFEFVLSFPFYKNYLTFEFKN